MSDEQVVSRGYWCALVAQPTRWLDRTCIGIALYGPDGNLVGFKCDTPDRAIARGDLGDWAHTLLSGSPWAGAPETVEEMEKTLARIGNTMSVIQWTDLMPVVGEACTQATLDDLYAGAVEARL